jgi:hypothetical protein
LLGTKPSAKETFLHSSPTQRLSGLPAVESAFEEARQQGALLDDLVDFNRTKLGLGINVILAIRAHASVLTTIHPES